MHSACWQVVQGAWNLDARFYTSWEQGFAASFHERWGAIFSGAEAHEPISGQRALSTLIAHAGLDEQQQTNM